MVFLKLTFVFAVCFIRSFNCSPDTTKPEDVGIVGGHRISIEKVPYMASLRLNGNYHWCGGSIIHEQFILTAAHCILPNREYKIVVGTDLKNRGGDTYDVKKIITHRKYSNKTFDHDICLIKLAKPLVFGPKVAKITLANKKTKVGNGELVDVTGWGKTKTNGSVSNDLLQVSVPVVPSSLCQKIYKLAKHVVTPRMLCAGSHGRDSCQGDSGGPLTLDNIQVGLVSFGLQCGEYPGIYTRITAMLPWIEKIMKRNT